MSRGGGSAYSDVCRSPGMNAGWKTKWVFASTSNSTSRAQP
jgi:hypothetical protein